MPARIAGGIGAHRPFPGKRQAERRHAASRVAPADERESLTEWIILALFVLDGDETVELGVTPRNSSPMAKNNRAPSRGAIVQVSGGDYKHTRPTSHEEVGS